jgi:hypothetical protein
MVLGWTILLLGGILRRVVGRIGPLLRTTGGGYNNRALLDMESPA